MYIYPISILYSIVFFYVSGFVIDDVDNDNDDMMIIHNNNIRILYKIDDNSIIQIDIKKVTK